MAPRRALIVGAALAGLSLIGCPAPRRVSGVVFAKGETTATGARALKKTLQGATVTWTCPPGVQGPERQTLTTDWGGGFKSKDFYSDVPGACELVVSKPGHLEFRERFENLCDEPSPGGCRTVHVAIELRAVEPAAAAVTAVPLDLPPAGSAQVEQGVLSVVLAVDGTMVVDGRAVPSDDAVLPIAKTAREKNPELRAVIKADASVPHGRVIHVLDLLKQAQVTKIAFGVKPL